MGVSSSAPQSKIPQRPYGGFVCLGAQPGESNTSPWELGTNKETETQRGLLKIAEPATQLMCPGASIPLFYTL